MLLSVWLAACQKKDEAATISLANPTRPGFVVQNKETPDTVILYIHGIFGDTVGTWTNPNGTRFFDLVKNDPQFKGRFDAYAFGFPSNYLASGSFDVRDAYKSLKNDVDITLRAYKRVIIVAHSMGGLVAMRYLLHDRTMLKKVPVVVLFATPQDPVQIASIGKVLLNNGGLADMRTGAENKFYGDLEDAWKGLKMNGSVRPAVVCAFEKRDTAGVVLVVPERAAGRYCDDPAPPIDADHLGIVKPDSAAHASYKVLAKALLDHAMKPAPDISPYTEEQNSRIKVLEGQIETNRFRFPDYAKDDIETLLKEFPAHANAHRLKANLHFNSGEFQQALDASNIALTLNPPAEVRKKVEINKVATLLALGKADEARPLLETLAKRDTGNELVTILTAIERLVSGDYATAHVTFESVMRTNKYPGTLAFASMGLAFTTALDEASGPERDTRAMECFAQAMQAEPKLRVWAGQRLATPLTLDGWNYSIYRDQFRKISSRPAYANLKNAQVRSPSPADRNLSTQCSAA
ncbi:MAG: alpha/beta fold hydrolase [Pseudomonadota bacterium]